MRRLALAVLLTGCDTGSIAVPPPPPAEAAPAPDFASGTRLAAVAWEVDGAMLLRHFYDLERKEECAFVDAGVPRVSPGPVYHCLPRGAVIHDAVGSLALFADPQCREGVALQPLEGPAAYAIDRPIDACAAPPVVNRALPPRSIRPYALEKPSLLNKGGCKQVAATVVVQPLGEAVPLDAFVRAEERKARAGTRIGPLVLVAADGARQVIGAWDHARSAAARVQDPGTRGDWRWFPSRIAFAAGGSVLFADAACTAEVSTKIARDAVCPLSAAFAFDGLCGGGDFIAIGAALDPTTLRERDAANACVAASPGVLAFERGDRILRESFAVAYPVERGRDRVKLRGWSDGATTPAWDTFVDVATNTPCTPALAADGAMRCLPATPAALDYFADSACTIPAFERVTDGCTDVAPGFVRVEDRVFQITGPAQLYELTGNRCAKRPAAPGTRGHVVEEVDVGRFSLATSRQLSATTAR